MRVALFCFVIAVPFALLGCPDNGAKADPSADGGKSATTAASGAASGAASAKPAASGGGGGW